MGTITFDVPAFLEHLTGGATSIEVIGSVVGECLDHFINRFPGAGPLLFDKSGRLLGHIELYVNDVSAFPEELARPVRDGDRISMLYLIVGG
jgi:molybdopterin converting factor small subunit